MKKFIGFLMVWLSVSLMAVAQTNTPLDKAKFNLIKNAVWFYSTDPNAKWVAPNDCKSSQDYNQLSLCSEGMLGVKAKIDTWKLKNAKSGEDLKNLQSQIDNDITKRNLGRKKLPQYERFKDQATKIINEVSENSSGVNSGTTDPTITKVNTGHDSVTISNVTAVDTGTGTIVETNVNEGSQPDFWLIGAIVLSLFSLGYAWFSSKVLNEKLFKLKHQTKDQDLSRNSYIEEKIKSLEAIVKSFDSSFEDFRNEFERKSKEVSREKLAGPIPADIPMAVAEIQPVTNSKFAKYADLGDGFSAGQLSDHQDNDKIFQMTILGNNAKSKVVNNRDAQRLALSNPTLYLNKTCKYETVPTSTSTIITQNEGELKLQGNKWLIVNPTLVSFE